MSLTPALSAEKWSRLQSYVALPSSPTTPKQVFILAVCVFLIAVGVRLLQWQDLKPQIESGQMHFGMTKDYKADAKNLLAGRLDLFVEGPNPPSDAAIMTHPPGYSLLLALIFGLFGESLTVWRLVHILLDACSVVGVFLIARELLPVGAAIIAGVIVAISPQLGFTSLVLLPDSPAVMPIVWAMFLFVRAYKQPRMYRIIGAGVLIGVSCWFRPNCLLLAPLLALLLFFLFPLRVRWSYSLVLVISTIVMIVPITIRNLVVFKQFIPVAIGVGNNLSEGIADYDDTNRFGLSQKDHLVNQREAQLFNRPDYTHSLYAPDGIERDRQRLKQALAIIKRHPIWFAGVMVRRMGFMLTQGPAPVISRIPPVTASLETTSRLKPVWSMEPSQSPEPRPDNLKVPLNSGQTPLFASPIIPLTAGRDHVLEIPIDLRRGRITIRIMTPDGRTVLSSAAVPDVFEGFPPDKPRKNVVQVPFISDGHTQMQFSIVKSGDDYVEGGIGKLELFELGESSYTWTRFPRWVLRVVQKSFKTERVLPFVFVGLALLLVTSGWRAVLLLTAVPLYYVLVQSPLHTEHRYVISIHYFLPVLAAFSLYWFVIKLTHLLRPLFRKATP